MSSSPKNIQRPTVIRLMKGDEEAFRLMYDAYYDKLYYYCLRLVKSEDVAQELLQDVFVKIWSRREQINPDLSFNAYLYQVTRNHVFDFFKAAAREQHLKEELLLSVATAHRQEEDELTYAEYAAIAETAIQQLPSQRKIIFQLSRRDGFSHQEIATNLGISKNTVKVQIFRALRAIREHLRIHTDLTISVLLALSAVVHG